MPTLLGKLVEQKADKQQSLQVQSMLKSVKLGDSLPTTQYPVPTTHNQYDIYDFQGHGFDGTGQIRGTVSTAEGNPYRFVVDSNGIDVAPFLRILHPTLEAVTGTADGRVSISGTIADLAPSSTPIQESEKVIYPYDVGIHITTSQLYYERAAGQGMPFTNAKPIRVHLKDDRWTIETLALSTANREPRTALIDKNPFVELAGTFDAKTNAMNFHGGAEGFCTGTLSTGIRTAREDVAEWHWALCDGHNRNT